MKEKIESKIDEIINFILAKSPEEITYSEYKILDARVRDLIFRLEQEKRAEEQKQKSEEMAKLLTRTFDYTPTISPSYLPEPNIKI